MERKLKLTNSEIVSTKVLCPCCGSVLTSIAAPCACGAIRVAEPLTESEFIVPKIGLPVASIFFALLGLLLLWAKIFAVAACIGLWCGLRSLVRYRRDPRHYGGPRLATTGLVLSALILLSLGGYWTYRIPKAINAYHDRREAATRATMYHLSNLLTKYKTEYGTYPQDLQDLRLITNESISDGDGWGQELIFSASSLVASKSGPVSLAHFQIVSLGPDGKPGTDDDLVLRDDLLISEGAKEMKPFDIPPLKPRQK